MEYNTNNTIEETRQLNLTGNIIPHSWYSKITFLSGGPDLLGTVILAEIVYWYRPREIKDERTGQLIGFKKKFAADMLQRSLFDFSKQFGSTKRQVADALKRLESAGLIIKKIRTVEVAHGRLHNVLYVAPVPSKIAELDKEALYSEKTEDEEIVSLDVSPATFERSTYYDRTYDLPRSNVVPTPFERSTYTENTTQITTKITAADAPPENPIAAAVFSKKIADTVSDSIIGETLTVSQQKAIADSAHALCSMLSIDQSQLSKEIEYVILSNTAFSNAGHDFNKKLNTIKKVIKEGRWNTPVGLTEKKIVDQKKIIDPISIELKDAEQDFLHWKGMVDFAMSKGQKDQAQKFQSFLQNAQRKMKALKEKLSCTSAGFSQVYFT